MEQGAEGINNKFITFQLPFINMAGIPMAYGIPFWAVTAVIYILAIGGVAVGIAFMLRGVLLRRGVSLRWRR